jgi:hypothetical protein
VEGVQDLIAAINRAFDALVAELKTRETDKGVAVFRNDASAGPLPPGEQVSVEVASEEVDRLLEQFAAEIPVVVLDRASDLPGVVPPDDGVASGIVHKGRIYLIREGLDGRSAVVRTLWHELLHFGLRRFLTREEYIRATHDLFAKDSRGQELVGSLKRIPDGTIL